MRSKIITISLYFISLNLFMCLILSTLLDLFINSNLMPFIALGVIFFISVTLLIGIEKIIVFKYVFRRTKADRKFVKSINNFCVVNNLTKTKIYTSSNISNKYIFIKTSKKNSILIVSKNIINTFNNVEQLEQVYDLIKSVSHYRTVLVSVNNFLFYLMLYPFIYIYKSFNFKFFEYIIVMLSNLHCKLNSNGFDEPFKLYAGDNFDDDLILSNISICSNNNQTANF